jgi:hypothetical protein
MGLGNDYLATGAGSYGMYIAIPRTATTPYMSVRYNENNSLGSWLKIAAGYADSAGTVTTNANLTGDVIANGPGSVPATLATVNSSPGIYGNSGTVPRITVDAKGRITNVTPTAINYPAQSLSFIGDVSGLGFTGSPVTLTLDTVNTDVYGSNNFLKFAVNGKGLITSATPVSGGDITTALGYVPVDDAIQLTINGVAHDLSASRSWSVGTVTTVGVTAGTGISASVSNPTTNPTISLTTKTVDGTGLGIFSSTLTGLLASTTYHVRAYATNSLGTSYGGDTIFITPASYSYNNSPILIDIDNNEYQCIQNSCGQIWTTKNLMVSHYRNGDSIPQVKDSTQWANLNTGAWCWYNNDSASY